MRIVTGLALGLIALWGCSPTDPPPPASRPAAPPERESPRQAGDLRGEDVLARVDGRVIRSRDVDRGLAIALHDVALARYRLRQERLRGLIARRLRVGGERAEDGARERVEILLRPPPPPRIEVPIKGARLRGAETARLTFVEFIDFQSTPSRALQPLLERVLERYPDSVRLAVRDLTLPYHRYAQAAAEAARCAGDQGAYWAYHATLLQEQPRLGAEDLVRYARRLGLETARFETCLEEGRHALSIQADNSLAALLGIERAPTLFANGLYIAPPIDYARLIEIVEAEIGVPAQATFRAPARSPSLEPEADGKPPLPAISPGQLLEPEAVLDLSRAEVERALAERPQLEARLGLSSGVFSGRRLLKLHEVKPGDLYDRFGLQPDDVLLLVDDEWVTDEANPLWRALEKRSEISLLIMRRGLPHRYRYRIR